MTEGSNLSIQQVVGCCTPYAVKQGRLFRSCHLSSSPHADTSANPPHAPPPPLHTGMSGQSLHTSLALDSHSVFKSYSHSGAHASDVTVNLKDLKALVGLCVEMDVDVGLRFDAPGVPLLAVPHVRGVQVRAQGHRGTSSKSASNITASGSARPAQRATCPCVTLF